MKSPKQNRAYPARNPKKDREAIERFNSTVEVGALVEVLIDDGSIWRTRTTAPAQLLGGHTPVVWLEGMAGCYLLDRVQRAKEGD